MRRKKCCVQKHKKSLFYKFRGVAPLPPPNDVPAFRSVINKAINFVVTSSLLFLDAINFLK